MIKKVEQYILENQLIDCGDKVLVALSGGADSVCLLRVLLDLREKRGFTVAAVHLNHHLRGEEAERDAAFCAQVCAKAGIVLHSLDADVAAEAKKRGQSVETAAREIRYALFDRLCVEKGYNKLAVAHNAQDNAETILMHLLRGSGSEGLRGILPMRGNIIRPLLCVTREEIEAYLACLGADFVTDSTNFETDYARNRIRHELLALMRKEYNSNLIETLGNTGYLMARDSDYLQLCAKEALQAVCTLEAEAVLVSRDAYMALHEAVALRVMKMAIAHVHGSMLDLPFDMVHRCHKLCCAGTAGKQVALLGGYAACMEYEHLRIARPENAVDYSYELLPGNRIYIPQADAYVSAELVESVDAGGKNIVYLDYDAISGPLVIRNRRAGDRFAPSGMSGTKKLQDFFVDAKLPARERSYWPLVCTADALLWVCGMRSSALCKAEAHTKRILKLTYEERTV